MEYFLIVGLVLFFLLILYFFSNKNLKSAKSGTTKNELEIYKNKVLYKVEKDLQNGNIEKAIDRLFGALECRPLEKEILDKLTELLLSKNEYVKAGKLLVLKENKSESESLAVQRFKQSLGNDSTLILRKIVNANFFRLRELSPIQMKILAELLDNVNPNGHSSPKFLLSLERYLYKKNAKYYS